MIKVKSHYKKIVGMFQRLTGKHRWGYNTDDEAYCVDEIESLYGTESEEGD